MAALWGWAFSVPVSVHKAPRPGWGDFPGHLPRENAQPLVALPSVPVVRRTRRTRPDRLTIWPVEGDQFGIAVRPTWVGVLDFQTRLPSALGGVTA